MEREYHEVMEGWTEVAYPSFYLLYIWDPDLIEDSGSLRHELAELLDQVRETGFATWTWELGGGSRVHQFIMMSASRTEGDNPSE